jgi:hypothetical protein
MGITCWLHMIMVWHFFFQQSQGNENDVLGVIQYVGTLKEIL